MNNYILKKICPIKIGNISAITGREKLLQYYMFYFSLMLNKEDKKVAIVSDTNYYLEIPITIYKKDILKSILEKKLYLFNKTYTSLLFRGSSLSDIISFFQDYDVIFLDNCYINEITFLNIARTVESNSQTFIFMNHNHNKHYDYHTIYNIVNKRKIELIKTNEGFNYETN